MIVEHRHGCEDDASVTVVLSLLHRGVSNAYRAITPIALERGSNFLVHGVDRYDAIYRPHGFAAIGSDAEAEGDKILHRLCRANTIESLHDEIGVAQPTITIVPSTSGTGTFRD